MDLAPDFPTVTGVLAMPSHWTLTLPAPFKRRIEDGSLVLWTPELTFWIDIWNNDAKVPADAQLARILKEANPDRSDERLERAGGLLRLTYELADDDGDEPDAGGPSISGHVISGAGYVQVAAYYDTPAARAQAYEVIHSIHESTP